MTRNQHGQYDRERGLPDNTGQPQGSGLYVWLQQEVQARFPDLLERARQLPDQASARYSFLLRQLQTMREQEARDILAEYERRRKLAAHESRQNSRRRLAQSFERQAETEQNLARRAWLLEQARKYRQRIEEAEERKSL